MTSDEKVTRKYRQSLVRAKNLPRGSNLHRGQTQ
jgi:hypothetical protein